MRPTGAIGRAVETRADVASIDAAVVHVLRVSLIIEFEFWRENLNSNSGGKTDSTNVCARCTVVGRAAVACFSSSALNASSNSCAESLGYGRLSISRRAS